MRIVTVIFLALLFGCGDDVLEPGQDGGPDATNQNQNQNENQNQNTNTNTTPVCGNAVLEQGEQCDLGEQNSDSAVDGCRTDCREHYCGDNVVDSAEECDRFQLSGNTCQTFGFTKGALACTPVTCEFDTSACSRCGNGIAEGEDQLSDPHYETCDGSDLRDQDCISIGQAQGVLGCKADCTWDISGCVGGGPVCGNGIVEEGEECDDGNHDTTDICPSGPAGTCQWARCGDGFVWAGVEECDDGNGLNGDQCPDGVGGTCELAWCGDGHVFLGVEECDTGSDPDCHAGCQTYCGDGIVNGGELCDFAHPTQGENCNPDCMSKCGDGAVQPTWEECEPALTLNCNNDCSLSVCGDGVCEDGDLQVGCPQDCYCGDGVCSGGEDPFNCPQDCLSECDDYNGDVCGDVCCLLDCCGTTCRVMNQQAGPGSILNCGVCGNTCPAWSPCYHGTCL